jgi:hypothetical protein|tara:strand:+ start:3032 stop:3358 length:327 start_codon:yes stop_codon:yes gene_type:complete
VPPLVCAPRVREKERKKEETGQQNIKHTKNARFKKQLKPERKRRDTNEKRAHDFDDDNTKSEPLLSVSTFSPVSLSTFLFNSEIVSLFFSTSRKTHVFPKYFDLESRT